MTDHSLCAECKADYNAWLDAPMLRRPPRIANGAAYDDTARGVMDNRWGRADDHWTLVRFQTRLVRRICREKHPLQAALFEVAA